MTEDAHEAICAAWIAAWGTPGSFPVQVDNTKFEQPDKAVWGRFSITFGNDIPMEIGNGPGRARRQVGFVSLQVFIPEDGGSRAAATATDRLFAAFVASTIRITPSGGRGVLTFDTVGAGPTPSGKRVGYQQFNATVNFRLDKNFD